MTMTKICSPKGVCIDTSDKTAAMDPILLKRCSRAIDPIEKGSPFEYITREFDYIASTPLSRFELCVEHDNALMPYTEISLSALGRVSAKGLEPGGGFMLNRDFPRSVWTNPSRTRSIGAQMGFGAFSTFSPDKGTVGGFSPALTYHHLLAASDSLLLKLDSKVGALVGLSISEDSSNPFGAAPFMDAGLGILYLSESSKDIPHHYFARIGVSSFLFLPPISNATHWNVAPAIGLTLGCTNDL